MKTLTGLTLDEARAKLDMPLPQEAYKAIPGRLQLTDIDPAWMRRALTAVFGFPGYGWGLSFHAEDLDIRTEAKQNEKNAVEAVVKKAQLWFILTGDKGNVTCSVDTVGACRNELGVSAYAIKGALTNALSTGASFIGFQESVFMGHRSHDDVQGQAPKPRTSVSVPDKVEPPAAHPVATPPVVPPAAASVETPPVAPPVAPPVVVPDKATCCHSCGVVLDASHRLLPVCSHCGGDTLTSDTKQLHEVIKPMVVSDRRRWLHVASTVTGRQIRAYSECGVDDLKGIIRALRANPALGSTDTPPAPPVAPTVPPAAPPAAVPPAATQPAPAATAPADGGRPPKLAIVQRIFAAGKRLGYTTPAAILSELSKRWKRTITSSTQLSDDELFQTMTEFEGVQP